MMIRTTITNLTAGENHNREYIEMKNKKVIVMLKNKWSNRAALPHLLPMQIVKLLHKYN